MPEIKVEVAVCSAMAALAMLRRFAGGADPARSSGTRQALSLLCRSVRDCEAATLRMQRANPATSTSAGVLQPEERSLAAARCTGDAPSGMTPRRRRSTEQPRARSIHELDVREVRARRCVRGRGRRGWRVQAPGRALITADALEVARLREGRLALRRLARAWLRQASLEPPGRIEAIDASTSCRRPRLDLGRLGARAEQHLDDGAPTTVTASAAEAALHDMLFSSGMLNKRLLGFTPDGFEAEQ